MSLDQQLRSGESDSGGPPSTFGNSRVEEFEDQAGISTLKQLSLLLGGVIILSIFALVALLQHMAGKQDELATQESQRQFSGLLNLQSRQIALHAVDYSNWDEAIAALLVDKSDAWWNSNAGAYAVNAFDLSFSMVVNGRDEALFTSFSERYRPDSGVIPIDSALKAIFADARKRPLAGSASGAAATGIVRIRDHLHLVAAVKFRPEKPSSKPNPDPDALLVFAKSLNDKVLPMTAEIMGSPSLTLTDQVDPEMNGLPLLLADGQKAGIAHWTQARPGKQMVGAVLPWVAGLFLIIFLAVLYAAARASRLMRLIRKSTERLRVLSRRLLEVQETERRRVAQELHDELGQSLTAIKINLMAGQNHQGGSPGTLDHENVRIVEAALQQIRRISLALRPSMLDDLGLKAALAWLAKSAAANGDVEVDFDCRMDQQRLPGAVETACYRIVQEALTNIRRHAKASKVIISLVVRSRHIRLAISDNGTGFRTVPDSDIFVEPSLGLLGMKERATSIGGTFTVHSWPEQGTTVEMICRLGEHDFYPT